ncbi:MAG TPA: 2,6-beta-D-fructofuranosidase [Planctomycetes bacterium]|nr:2,6-beta-D-fructofuranosidase [Planctomycetota bacterium]
MRKTIISTLLFCCLANLVWAEDLKIKIDKKFINFPATSDGDESLVEIFIDGKKEFYFDIILDEDETDFWVFLDVSKFKGKTAILKSNIENTDVLKKIYQSDERKYLKNVYKEKYRPQVHFSTMRGWMNDVNGLVYYDGEYHMFHQHNPYGWGWGNMHWGHAVSTDLVHWKQLPEALYPDHTGTAFSGSCVIDYKNTSGFKTGENDVMVAIYTTWHRQIGERQNIAYSNDKGRTWTKYENNPVISDREKKLKSGNTRDPNVFWHKGIKKWVMILFERIGNTIFTSDDLKTWKEESHFETFWECPELFELPVDGNPNNTKWVVYGVNGDYLIGDFDGRKYTKQAGLFNYINGPFLAAQTFENIPEKDGRRIQIGWGYIQTDDMPFNCVMTFPTELTLRTTPNGIRMFNEPVEEIKKLHKKTYRPGNVTVREANRLLRKIDTELLHIKFELENLSAINYGIQIDDAVIKYDLKDNNFTYTKLRGRRDHEHQGAEFELEPFKSKYLPDLASNIISYEIILDRTSLEVFIDKGRYTIVLPRTLNPVNKAVQFMVGEDGVIKINGLEVYELESIWR